MRFNNYKRVRRILGVMVVAGLVWLPVGSSAFAAESAWIQTSRVDFESGTSVHLDTSSSPGDVKLGVAGIDYIYAFRGYNKLGFWRYSLASNNWTTLADEPDTVKWGAALAYNGGNYIYAFHGNNSNDFWRYSITTNNWSVMAGAPGTVNAGGALTFNNGYIFAFRGNNTRDFWRYNIAANSWMALANTHDNILGGGAITSDGGNYIYAFEYENTDAFWRYDISADSWTKMASTPETMGVGAALAYDGNRYIYALRGKYNPNFWKYDTFTDTWSIKAEAPSVVEWGGALTCAGDNYVYAIAGGYTQQFWRYNIAANTWEWRASTPASVYDGGALVRGGATYYASGNMASSNRDTGYNADFGTISWTGTVPVGTSIKFQIASNNDGSSWVFRGPDGTTSTYYTTSGAAIWSGDDGNRYLKYKIYFSTTDASVTPILRDVTITYQQQVVLPVTTTGDAVPVGGTAATLHGTVTADGNEACQYRFQYGTSTGNYTINTAWTGNVTVGESFSANITGLGKGTKYYFWAQVKNSAGTGNSHELTLLTKPDPPIEGSFKATTISDTQINLSWVKGEGTRRTMVRRKTGSYPVDINDGVLVYFDTGTSVSDTGLTPGITYYYSAWSEVTGSQQWSVSSSAASATTSAVPQVAVGGIVFKVNKAAVLAPWLSPVMLLLVGGGIAASLRKKTSR